MNARQVNRVGGVQSLVVHLDVDLQRRTEARREPANVIDPVAVSQDEADLIDAAGFFDHLLQPAAGGDRGGKRFFVEYGKAAAESFDGNVGARLGWQRQDDAVQPLFLGKQLAPVGIRRYAAGEFGEQRRPRGVDVAHRGKSKTIVTRGSWEDGRFRRLRHSQ